MKKRGYVLLLSSLFVTSCSSYYANNNEEKYLQSVNGPALVVPAPLTTFNVSHFYDLPSQNQNAKVSITPPSS